MTVVIPSVVIVRAHGTKWVVTTNTGAPPNRNETFYYVSHGKGGLADPNVRAVVLERCTSRDHH